MKYFRILIFFQLILFLYSCSTVKEGIKNQKKSSSDEFLVEKKSPLVMPPDYNDLPIPDQNKESPESNENKIKDLLTKNESENSEINIFDPRYATAIGLVKFVGQNLNNYNKKINSTLIDDIKEYLKDLFS